MKRRFWMPILAVILVVVCIGGCLPLKTPEAPVPTEATKEPATAHTAATVPQPNPYLGHFFLGARNNGDSRKLLGKVMLTFFLFLMIYIRKSL